MKIKNSEFLYSSCKPKTNKSFDNYRDVWPFNDERKCLIYIFFYNDYFNVYHIYSIKYDLQKMIKRRFVFQLAYVLHVIYFFT